MSSQGVMSSKEANNNPGLCPAKSWCLWTVFFFPNLGKKYTD